jgi:hypothetical protein
MLKCIKLKNALDFLNENKLIFHLKPIYEISKDLHISAIDDDRNCL